MRYKRFSRVVWTFSIPKFRQFSMEREFFNSYRRLHSEPRSMSDMGILQQLRFCADLLHFRQQERRSPVGQRTDPLDCLVLARRSQRILWAASGPSGNGPFRCGTASAVPYSARQAICPLHRPTAWRPAIPRRRRNSFRTRGTSSAVTPHFGQRTWVGTDSAQFCRWNLVSALRAGRSE